MNIHNYHPVTFEYLSTNVADLDPIDNKPLIPAFATSIEPPNTVDNQAAIFKNGGWQVVDDYRGYNGYNKIGDKQSINYLGVSPDDSWTIERPFILSESIDKKRLEINSGLSSALSVITKKYTVEEINSWTTQESEAKTWINNNTESTPFLDGVIAHRAGIDKITLVNKVLDNASVFKTASGAAIGKKQAFINELNALPETATQADIDAIKIIY